MFWENWNKFCIVVSFPQMYRLCLSCTDRILLYHELFHMRYHLFTCCQTKVNQYDQGDGPAALTSSLADQNWKSLMHRKVLLALAETQQVISQYSADACVVWKMILLHVTINRVWCCVFFETKHEWRLTRLTMEWSKMFFDISLFCNTRNICFNPYLKFKDFVQLHFSCLLSWRIKKNNYAFISFEMEQMNTQKRKYKNI